ARYVRTATPPAASQVPAGRAWFSDVRCLCSRSPALASDDRRSLPRLDRLQWRQCKPVSTSAVRLPLPRSPPTALPVSASAPAECVPPACGATSDGPAVSHATGAEARFARERHWVAEKNRVRESVPFAAPRHARLHTSRAFSPG